MTQDSFAARYLSWLGAHSRREWPNLYVDSNGFLAGYLVPKDEPDEEGQPALTVRPSAAEQLAIYRPIEAGASPLLQLAFELVNWFRVAPKIDFKATDYLAPGDSSLDSYQPVSHSSGLRLSSRSRTGFGSDNIRSGC